MAGNKPKAPKPTEQEKALERAQLISIAEANTKTNSSLKRLLSGQQNTRVFRGSPLLRGEPSDTAKLPAPARNPLLANEGEFDFSKIAPEDRESLFQSDPALRARARNSLANTKRGGKYLGDRKLGKKFLDMFDAKYGAIK